LTPSLGSVALKPTKTVDTDAGMPNSFLNCRASSGRPKSDPVGWWFFIANHIVEGLLKLMGINKHTSLAYRPQANGLVGRCIKEVGDSSLRHYYPGAQSAGELVDYLPMGNA